MTLIRREGFVTALRKGILSKPERLVRKTGIPHAKARPALMGCHAAMNRRGSIVRR